jgi:hypothetical protein
MIFLYLCNSIVLNNTQGYIVKFQFYYQRLLKNTDFYKIPIFHIAAFLFFQFFKLYDLRVG